MIGGSILYMLLAGLDMGTAAEQLLNGMYTSFLLLAIPLTVCVAVMGRYIPELGYLNVLLGVEPVLSPEARFYQRLVARDQDEAISLAGEYAAEHGQEALFDELLIPALALIDTDRHVIIESAHPSPLSARNGFFGSRPFSRANDALVVNARYADTGRVLTRTGEIALAENHFARLGRRHVDRHHHAQGEGRAAACLDRGVDALGAGLAQRMAGG